MVIFVIMGKSDAWASFGRLAAMAFLVPAFCLSAALDEASAVPGDETLDDSRFREAVEEKEPAMREFFAGRGVGYPPDKVFIRVFKAEGVLELWALSGGDSKYTFIKSYGICKLSGELGPKRRIGDMQVPEGFYYIERFNPESDFHLSLGLNFPNHHDRRRGWYGRDIFIHGDCITMGCIPITDENIKELYVVAARTKAWGQQRIPVHIFPGLLNEAGLKRLKDRYGNDQRLISFWENLKEGFDFFDKTNRVPMVYVDGADRYFFISGEPGDALFSLTLRPVPGHALHHAPSPVLYRRLKTRRQRGLPSWEALSEAGAERRIDPADAPLIK